MGAQQQMYGVVDATRSLARGPSFAVGGSRSPSTASYRDGRWYMVVPLQGARRD